MNEKKEIIKVFESLTKKLFLNGKEKIALDELMKRKCQVEIKYFIKIIKPMIRSLKLDTQWDTDNQVDEILKILDIHSKDQ